MGNHLIAALSTHPPLEARIKAILPHWDGNWPKVSLPDIAARSGRSLPTKPPSGAEASGGNMAHFATALAAGAARVTAAQAQTALNRIGQPTQEEVAVAVALSEGIPADLQTVLRDSAGAQAGIFAVVLSGGPGARALEETVLSRLTDHQTIATASGIAARIQGWHSAQLIAMIDLAMPALRRLTPAEYGRFSHILSQLIAADGQMDLFEFMVQKIVRRNLDLVFRRTTPPRIEVRRFQEVQTEASDILAAFASLSGAPGSPPHQRSLQAAVASLHAAGIAFEPVLAPVALDRIDAALDRFDRAVPLVKKQLILACAAAVFSDGQVSSNEAELLRAVADSIGCPVPPYSKTTILNT
jgi:uncharacterized tellurite resistance protein B-like protein